MPPQLTHYITEYGYLAIFLIVFLQEIGIPTIVPNEISLLFFGYLAYTHTLNLFVILGLVIFADISGTALLYLLFYYFGKFLKKHKPRWLAVPSARIAKLRKRIEDRGSWGIFLGRMTPFVRAYTSVIAGLLRINAKEYLTMVVLSALCWTGSYVIIGWFLGPSWEKLASKINSVSEFVIILSVLIVLSVFVSAFIKRKKAKKI